jgi:hypothetical protein
VPETIVQTTVPDYVTEQTTVQDPAKAITTTADYAMERIIQVADALTQTYILLHLLLLLPHKRQEINVEIKNLL